MREPKATYKTVPYYWRHLAYQSLAAVIFVFIVLSIFGHITKSSVLWAVGSGALSSSSFLVFGQPHSESGKPWNVLFGYVIGIFVGECIHLIMQNFMPLHHTVMYQNHFYVFAILAACSVGITLILMILFKVSHPPASGMALVLVIDVRDYFSLLVIAGAVLFLVLIRIFFSKRLVNLL